MWGWGRKRQVEHPLDRALLRWTEYDPFRVRDLLDGGCLILGRAGSGKTSSSGRFLMQSIVNDRQSGGLVVAAKPEDAKDVQRVFAKARRQRDLIVFDAEGPSRCNFFGCLKRPRDVVQFITTMSEVMKRGDSKGGGDNSRFYDAQEERTIYNAVAALQAARQSLTAPNLHRFIMTAATEPAQLVSEKWQASYHAKVLEAGGQTKKPPLEEHDYQLCLDFWIREWPGIMNVKTRGNILAGVQGSLFPMNTSIVREMTSGATNCSPQDALNGKWILVNFPPSVWGHTGLLLSTGWKQLVEQAVLERKADDRAPYCVIWCDEAHAVATSFDAVSYIPQCRSHKGALIFLTQSVSSFYAAMKGEAGRHQADAMMANFSTVIAHVCDPASAKWLASKLGRKKKILCSGNNSPRHDCLIWDQMYGASHVSSGFSEHLEPVLEDSEFMVGRTGGPQSRYLADAIVIRSGQTFANGESHLRVVFSQKG